MAAPTDAVPVLAALRSLQLVDDCEGFFSSVALHLCGHSPVAELEARYGLELSDPVSNGGLLFAAAKAVLSRVAARSYVESQGSEALRGDVVAAGLKQAAASWVVEAAEAAALPRAAEIRRVQAHAAAALTSDYLEDFDWQARCAQRASPLARAPLAPSLRPLHFPPSGPRRIARVTGVAPAARRRSIGLRRAQLQYVLSSSELSQLRQPLLTLQLQMGARGQASPQHSRLLELDLAQLDATLRHAARPRRPCVGRRAEGGAGNGPRVVSWARRLERMSCARRAACWVAREAAS